MVQTGTGQEKLAQKCLERDFKVWLPTYRRLVHVGSEASWKGRRVETVPRPLFPGYLFIALDLDQDPWQSVFRAYGVRGMLGGGLRPQAVPERAMRKLRGAADDEGVMRRALAKLFKAGQRVAIADGPFAWFDGEVERVDESGNVRVLLSLFGRKQPVTFQAHQLKGY